MMSTGARWKATHFASPSSDNSNLSRELFASTNSKPVLISSVCRGMVANLRTGAPRKMERADFLTKRLRIVATNTPTPIYDYPLRSISSANDQPADLEWMSHFELLHGFFLIGHYNFHIWPIWTGVGGNGKSENARLIKSTLGDFCAVARWSELTHDERGGNTTTRLNFKLLQSRVALVEGVGQTSGINGILETSHDPKLTGGGEIVGADLYRQRIATSDVPSKVLNNPTKENRHAWLPQLR